MSILTVPNVTKAINNNSNNGHGRPERVSTPLISRQHNNDNVKNDKSGLLHVQCIIMSNLSIETHKSIVIYELMTTAVGFTGEVAIEY